MAIGKSLKVRLNETENCIRANDECISFKRSGSTTSECLRARDIHRRIPASLFSHTSLLFLQADEGSFLYDLSIQVQAQQGHVFHYHQRLGFGDVDPIQMDDGAGRGKILRPHGSPEMIAAAESDVKSQLFIQ